MGLPQNRWFIMGNPIKVDGGTPILGNFYSIWFRAQSATISGPGGIGDQFSGPSRSVYRFQRMFPHLVFCGTQWLLKILDHRLTLLLKKHHKRVDGDIMW